MFRIEARSNRGDGAALVLSISEFSLEQSRELVTWPSCHIPQSTSTNWEALVEVDATEFLPPSACVWYTLLVEQSLSFCRSEI